MAAILEVKNLTVRYGDFIANDHVNMSCEHGSVISLLGENGAGKTTMMKAIYGMLSPSEGEILFEGEHVDLKSPKVATSLGIQMVHQHFMLVGHLTVAENIVLGKEIISHGILKGKEASEKVRVLSEQYGLKVNPDQLVCELSVGEKQRVEILKALYHGAKLLILDEPTAVLTPQEISELFDVMNRLKADGKTIIIITHKLKETMEVADDVYVLRHGKMVGHISKKETDIQSLTRMMVGHDLKPFEKEIFKPGKEIVSLKDISLISGGIKVLDSVGFSIRAGEIYGLAGIEGNGQEELVEVLSGIQKASSGAYFLNGKDVSSFSVRELLDSGVSCVHSDRHDRGLLLELSASGNILLGRQHLDSYRKNGLLDYSKAEEITKEIIEKYDVYPPYADYPAASFSGGNQQKLVVGREFYTQPVFAIIAQPTRGVDIGVCETIHESILSLRRNGAAILLISADMDELFKLSDRIGVIYEGHIVKEDAAESFTPLQLGFYMGGGEDEKA